MRRSPPPNICGPVCLPLFENLAHVLPPFPLGMSFSFTSEPRLLPRVEQANLCCLQYDELRIANLRKMRKSGDDNGGEMRQWRSENSISAARFRELRQINKATQAQFAERIGISVSYLNQIENNQRPVSAAVLIALAEKFRVDLSILSGEGDRLLSALTEALNDPLFEAQSASLQELEAGGVRMRLAWRIALIACHRAYRHNSEQLASIDDTLGRSPGIRREHAL